MRLLIPLRCFESEALPEGVCDASWLSDCDTEVLTVRLNVGDRVGFERDFDGSVILELVSLDTECVTDCECVRLGVSESIDTDRCQDSLALSLPTFVSEPD